jgi:hypothetical protein
VVEETKPVSPYLSPDAPEFRPGTLDQVQKQMEQEWAIDSLRSQRPEWERYIEKPGPPPLSGAPPWMRIQQDEYQRSPFDVARAGMPQDAARVRPITPRDIIATLPEPQQIEAMEQLRQFEESGERDPMTWPERLRATKGMTLATLAGAYEGVLNVGELIGRTMGSNVPGVQRGTAVQVDPDYLAAQAQQMAESVEEFREKAFPAEGAVGFFDVLDDPRLFLDWAFPTMAQGLTSSGLILGALAAGGPAGLGMAFAFNYPEAVGELEAAGVPREDALKWGAALNLPIAFWDTVLPGMILQQVKTKGMSEAAGQLLMERARREMRKGGVRRTVEAMGRAGLVEAGTEGLLQEGTLMFGGDLARQLTGEEQYTFEEYIRRIVEAGAAGFLPGAIMGGGSSIRQDIPQRSLGNWTLREARAGELEVKGATGEFGEKGVELANQMREERIDKELDEAPQTERGIDIGPPQGQEDRRTYSTKQEELRDQILSGTAGSKHNRLMDWVQTVRDRYPPDAPGDPAFRYANTLAGQVLDNRTDEEMIRPSQFMQAFPGKFDTRLEEISRLDERQQAPDTGTQPATAIPLDPATDARMEVEDLQLMEGAQYKKYGKQAAAKGLEGAKEWNDDLAGILLVWRGPPGEQYDKPVVINGHNRYAAAVRLKSEGKTVPSLRVRFIEAETLGDARAIGALTNIAEGRGTVWDAAEFFREGGYTIDDLQKKGLALGEEKVNRGYALSKLIPDIYKLAFGGSSGMNEEKGVIIGQADLSDAEQRGLLKHFRKKGTPAKDKLSNLIALAQGEAQVVVQGGLFGEEHFAESLLEEKADIKTAVDKMIRADAALSRKLLSAAAAAREKGAGEINELRAAEIGQEAADLEQAFYVAQREDPVIRDYLDSAARIVKGHKTKKEKNNAIRQQAKELVKLLAESESTAEIGRAGGEADRGRVAPEGEGRVSESEGETAVQEAQATYAPEVVTPENVEIGEEWVVAKNPAYAHRALAPVRESWVVKRVSTGEIVQVGKYGDMVTLAREMKEGRGLKQLGEGPGEVVEAETPEVIQTVIEIRNEKHVQDEIKRTRMRLRQFEKKIKDRGSSIFPNEIEGAADLVQQRDDLRAYLDHLHSIQNEYLAARREAAGEPPMILVEKRYDPETGRTHYASAPSPTKRREMVEQVLQERAKRAEEKRKEEMKPVRRAKVVYSAPTPFYNLSMNLDEWLARLKAVLPRTKDGKKIRRVGAVFPTGATGEELIDEVTGLMTHLAQNPILVEQANSEQVERLRDYLSHPWFGGETKPGSGTKPVGEKKAYYPNRQKDSRGEPIDMSRPLTRDTEHKQQPAYYYENPITGARTYFFKAQYRIDADRSDPLTDALKTLKRSIENRGTELFLVKEGRKAFEGTTKIPPAEDTGDVVELSPDQGDMFEEEEGEDVRLGAAQQELQLDENSTQAILARQRQIISNYYGPWKAGEASERQLTHLYTAMKMIVAYNADNQSAWGFTLADLNKLDAHFGTMRWQGVKEPKVTPIDGLAQADAFDWLGGGGVGRIDYMASETMPGAGQRNDDPALTRKYEEMLEERGLAWMRRKEKIPSTRDAIRQVGRALMTPVSTGRTSMGRAFGQFLTHFRSIRTKWAYDMETVGHEVGHALMQLVWREQAYTDSGKLSNRILQPWDYELAVFGEDLANWQEAEDLPQRLEWFAEFVRRWISTPTAIVEKKNGTKAAVQDLDIANFIEETLKESEPGVLEAIDYARFVYKHWRNQTPEARMLSQFMLHREVQKDRAWAWVMVPPLVRVKRAWIDLHVPFDTVVKTYNPGLNITDRSIPLDENPAMLIRLLGGAAAAGDAAWMYGMEDAETGLRTSEGPEQILMRAFEQMQQMGYANQEAFHLLTAFGASLRTRERGNVNLERAKQYAEKLAEQHQEPNRFIVRESETEPGAYNVYDLKSEKAVGRPFKQYVLGMALSDADAVIANAKQAGYHDVFMEAMEGLYAFANARLDWLVQMGVLTQETADTVKEGSRYYVPFVPVIEKLDQRRAEYQRAHPRHEIAKPPSAPRRMKAPGSATVKRNWIDQLYIDTQYLTLLGFRHRALQSLYNLVQRHRGTGVFMEPIAKPVKVNTATVKQMLDRLETIADTEMVDYMRENLGKDALEEVLMLFAPGDYMNNIDTVRVRDPDTGDYKWLQVNDPELLGALLGVETQSSPALKAVTMTGIAKALRLGATLSPGFSLYRNPGRDAIQAWIMSEWGIKLGYDHVRAVYHMLGRDELYEKFLSSGAAFSSLLDFDQKGIARKIEKAQSSKIRNVVGNVVEAAKLLGTWTENMNRFAEYERAYEQLRADGFGEMEARTRAAYAARDITVDFWRHGYQTAAIRQMVAFWNANLQGYDKLIRTFRENKARFLWRTFQGITVPSLMLMAVNYDDDDYWKLPQWLRDFYWLVPIDPGALLGGAAGALTGNPAAIGLGIAAGHTVWENMFADELAPDDAPGQGTRGRDLAPVVERNGKFWIKFPKPFLLGQLFGTSVERAVAYGVKQDGDMLGHLRELFFNEVTSLVPFPTGWRGLIEIMLPRGYDFFRRRDLMGEEMAGTDRWMQYTEGTSELAKLGGRLTRDLRIGGEQGLSPVKIDHLMYAYFGTLMRDATKLTDLAINLTGRAAEATGIVEKGWGGTVQAGRADWELAPLVGDLFQRWPYQASYHVDQIYKLWDEADRRYRSHSRQFSQDVLLRNGGANARAYLAAHPGMFGDYSEIAAAYAQLSLLNMRIRAAQKDPRLSDKERDLRIASLWEERNRVANRALTRWNRRRD